MTVPWWVLGVVCVLVVAGVGWLVWSDRREESTVGQHHWVGDDDLEPDADAVLLAAVTGLGEQREPDEQAQQRADALDPADWPDLTGVRDRDPQAPHPWRTQ